MRKTCLECVMKHLGSAAVFIKEYEMGYPNYKGYVYGELDHAADECFEKYPSLAMCIREHRLNWASVEGYKIPFEALFCFIDTLEKIEPGGDVLLPETVTEGLSLDGEGHPIFSMDTRP